MWQREMVNTRQRIGYNIIVVYEKVEKDEDEWKVLVDKSVFEADGIKCSLEVIFVKGFESMIGWNDCYCWIAGWNSC